MTSIINTLGDWYKDIKRMRYYLHEMLLVGDFEAEQLYHRNMRYLHNRVLHGAGIVEGLQVTKKGAKSIEVSPGVAISESGRELVLAQPKTLDVSGTGEVTVRICAVDDTPETTTGNDQVGKRTTEKVEITVGPCSENSVDSIALTAFNLTSGGNVPATIPYAVGTLSVAQMETRLNAIEAQLRRPRFYTIVDENGNETECYPSSFYAETEVDLTLFVLRLGDNAKPEVSFTSGTSNYSGTVEAHTDTTIKVKTPRLPENGYRIKVVSCGLTILSEAEISVRAKS